MSCEVENSQKNNCRGVMCIQEGRVFEQTCWKNLKQESRKSTKKEVFLKSVFSKLEDIAM